MKHIAVVEDEALMREELADMLRRAGYAVTEVTDWSWRYKTADGTANSIEHEIKPKDGFVFDFTNSRENGKWLGGDAYSKNVFGTIIETDSGN